MLPAQRWREVVGMAKVEWWGDGEFVLKLKKLGVFVGVDLLYLTLAKMHKVYGLQQDGSWYIKVLCCPRASHLSNQQLGYCKPPGKGSL